MARASGHKTGRRVTIVTALRLIGPLLMVGAITFLATRRRLIRTFQRANATGPAQAIVPATRLLTRWWLHRLHRCGVLEVTPTGSYWLRQEAWQAYQATRRHRALFLVASAGVLALLWSVLR